MSDEIKEVSADLRVLSTTVSHLEANNTESKQQLGKIDDRMSKIDDRVRKLEMLLYVAMVIATIFGIGGAFGVYAVKEAHNQITDIDNKSKELITKQGQLSRDIETLPQIIRRTTVDAEGSISNVKTNALTELGTFYDTTKNNYESLKQVMRSDFQDMRKKLAETPIEFEVFDKSFNVTITNAVVASVSEFPFCALSVVAVGLHASGQCTLSKDDKISWKISVSGAHSCRVICFKQRGA